MLLQMNTMLESVRDRHWFDGSSKVLNEIEIIEPGGRIYRPDRVLMSSEITVIDFKFGSIKSLSHERQVARYMSLIRGMGTKPVKGFLWYLEDNEIIEVI